MRSLSAGKPARSGSTHRGQDQHSSPNDGDDAHGAQEFVKNVGPSSNRAAPAMSGRQPWVNRGSSMRIIAWMTRFAAAAILPQIVVAFFRSQSHAAPTES